MPSSTTKSSRSTKTSSSRESHSTRRRGSSSSSQSTTPTSPSASPRPSDYAVKPANPSSSRGSASGSARGPRFQTSREQHHEEDLSPATSLYPRSSTDTYASTTASDAEEDGRYGGDLFDEDDDEDYDGQDDGDDGGSDEDRLDYAYDHIPVLPPYCREAAEPNARPATPADFARLFPSMDRLSIRHDEFTPDGNMNLRIDTVVNAGSAGRRRTAIQLFHLRMYDLASRHFSLRRYGRDSGREVCNSKRKLAEPPKAKEREKKSEAAIDAPLSAPATKKGAVTPATPRPTLQRSMSTAIKTLGGMARPSSSGGPGGVFRRTNSGGSIFSAYSKASSTGTSSRPSTATSNTASSTRSRSGGDEYFAAGTALDAARAGSKAKAKKARRRLPALPTNTIKLEFCNYARVDVARRGKGAARKRYEFAWWGHSYQWRREVGRAGSGASFHLVRDGDAARPVAHIVPENRSPNQVLADESAGGWVPPCHMWIADESVLDAMTDVGDVIMATGLMALVDDCIKERWGHPRRVHRFPVPLTSRAVDLEYVGPRALMQHVFGGGRRGGASHSHSQSQPTSPLRYANPISAY